MEEEMGTELKKVGLLRIMGIAVAAFLLGIGAYKGTLEILHLDTISENDLQNLNNDVSQSKSDLKDRPTKIEAQKLKDSRDKAEEELNSWKKKHDEWLKYETELKKAWVKIWEHDTYKGRSKKFVYEQNIVNFHSINFDNKGSSAKWNIPIGYRAVLYGDNTYNGSQLIFEGTGKEQKIANFENHNVGDQGSSLIWEKSP